MSEFKIHDSAESLVQDMQQETQSQPQETAPAPEPQVEQQAAPEPQVQQTEPQAQPQVAEQNVDQQASEPDNVIEINGHKSYVTDAPIDDNTQQTEPTAGQQYSLQDMDGAVAQYLSERLGVQMQSLDDLAQLTQAPQLDERLQSIAKFVQDTGRDPQDWFRYQSLNPSEMDDMTAVRVQMASKYPNLSYEEVETLISNKYGYDKDLADEGEVRMKQLQLKIDAQEAKQSIEGIRNQYAAPKQPEQQQQQSIINEDWVRSMAQEVNDFEGMEFDLGNGKLFSYNIDDRYRGQLVQKNASLDSFFNQYVRQDGSWDFDMLSAHQTVLDNVDNIVKAAYQQGMGDGQRNVVDRAANVTPGSPAQQPTNNNQNNDAVSQVLNYMGRNSGLSFNI
jgi:hypothetical protein